MEIRELQGFILLIVLVGMILGVGIITLDKFEASIRDDTTITNETVAISGTGTGSLSYVPFVSLSVIVNGTTKEVDPSDSYSANVTEAGAITSNLTEGNWNFTYVYEKDEEASLALGNVTSEINKIPNDWMGLIVTVAILALILTLVIRSFAARKR